MTFSYSADLELAARAILFSAAGTAGQRCTTLRRLIVHDSVADALLARVGQLFAAVQVGDPRANDTLIGPLRPAPARGRHGSARPAPFPRRFILHLPGDGPAMRTPGYPPLPCSAGEKGPGPCCAPRGTV